VNVCVNIYVYVDVCVRCMDVCVLRLLIHGHMDDSYIYTCMHICICRRFVHTYMHVYTSLSSAASYSHSKNEIK
jgi:hypothetical protein